MRQPGGRSLIGRSGLGSFRSIWTLSARRILGISFMAIAVAAVGIAALATWGFSTELADGGTGISRGLVWLIALAVAATTLVAWFTADRAVAAMLHDHRRLPARPEYYDFEKNAEIPAEEFFRVEQGDNFGWPYCYYDKFRNRKLLAPEYGGDGKKEDK